MVFLERGAMTHAHESDPRDTQLLVEETFVLFVQRAARFVEECDHRFFQEEPGEETERADEPALSNVKTGRARAGGEQRPKLVSGARLRERLPREGEGAWEIEDR